MIKEKFNPYISESPFIDPIIIIKKKKRKIKLRSRKNLFFFKLKLKINRNVDMDNKMNKKKALNLDCLQSHVEYDVFECIHQEITDHIVDENQ